MQCIGTRVMMGVALSYLSLLLCSCSSFHDTSDEYYETSSKKFVPAEHIDFAGRVPQRISTNSKAVVVYPREHVWAAYDASGDLIRAGQASAGSSWCSDTGRPCHTRPGTYHVYSLGSPDCKSHIFPLHKGGAPMPYCMYFNNGEALHGVPDSEVGDGNYSHGCVRMHVSDAEWLRYNFVEIGTKVVIRPY